MEPKVDLSRLQAPRGGWPDWALSAPYDSAAHPMAARASRVGEGANCQTYAYAVLALFGRHVPPHRSSELWNDRRFSHPDPEQIQDLDLVLFNDRPTAWGAHVAVALGDGLLHLCAEAGRPMVWTWGQFAERQRYRTVVGLVRTSHVSDNSVGSARRPWAQPGMLESPVNRGLLHLLTFAKVSKCRSS